MFCYLSSPNRVFFPFCGRTVTLAAGTWGTRQTCLPIKRSLARLFSCRGRVKLFNHTNPSYTSQTTVHYSSQDPGGSVRADNVSSIYRGQSCDGGCSPPLPLSHSLPLLPGSASRINFSASTCKTRDNIGILYQCVRVLCHSSMQPLIWDPYIHMQQITRTNLLSIQRSGV